MARGQRCKNLEDLCVCVCVFLFAASLWKVKYFAFPVGPCGSVRILTSPMARAEMKER